MSMIHKLRVDVVGQAGLRFTRTWHQIMSQSSIIQSDPFWLYFKYVASHCILFLLICKYLFAALAPRKFLARSNELASLICSLLRHNWPIGRPDSQQFVGP